MNPIVAHLVSGQVLFTAFPLMIVLVLLCERIPRRDLRRLVVVMVWNCGLLGISTAAYPLWVLGFFVASLVHWSVRARLPDRRLVRSASHWLPVLVALLILANEIRWVVRPTVTPVADRAIVVLGDSLSAGLGEREGVPWPYQLRDSQHVQVHNLAEAGATTADALREIKLVDNFPGLVIVELGGNDLLRSRPLADFEHDLDGILTHLRQTSRSVVMVELPVLPGKNAWGVVQRRLATQHACPLIPKRLLVEVFAAPNSTVDTLHLSQSGHQHLAAAIWSVIEPALPK